MIRSFNGVRPTLAADSFIAETAVVIGNVEIGPEASVWYGCVLRGDVGAIRVGARSNIQDGTIVHCTRRRFDCLIGADVVVGHGAILHGCTLEDGCFIGMGATVMDGVVVEQGAMVAAGALVTPGKRVKAGELWGGSPAKPLRALTPEDQARFTENVANYVALSAAYRAEGV